MKNLLQKKYYILLLTVLPLILDIITKYLIKTSLQLGESIPVIKGFFNIVYVLNPGAAFSILHDMNEAYRRTFFISIASIVLVMLFIFFLKEKRPVTLAGTALIMSGALGNLIDRINIGKVVDFLDFYVKSYHWPAFNVADICVTVGAGLLILDIIFLTKKQEPENTENTEINNQQ